MKLHRSPRSAYSKRLYRAPLIGGLILCLLAAACTSSPAETADSPSTEGAQPAESPVVSEAPATEPPAPTEVAAHEEPIPANEAEDGRCEDLHVLGSDPSGRFSYCASPQAEGLTKILVDDGSGPVDAFADDQRLFRLRPFEGVDWSVSFRFVDSTTAVWGNESSTALARINTDGAFVDLYEFVHPFHYYDLRANDVDERDLAILAPVFVNSYSPRTQIDTSNVLLANFPEPDAPVVDGSWYPGQTLSADPACGASTLYRDEFDGFSRVLDPAIELDTVQAIRATDATSGDAVHTASRHRLIAIAVACPAEYEGLRIYIASESINYGDGGPRSNPMVALWGSDDSRSIIDHHPTLTPAGQQPFSELISISLESPVTTSLPSSVVLTVIDLDGVEQELRVFNEVGRSDAGAFLRVEAVAASPGDAAGQAQAASGRLFEPVAQPQLANGLPATWLGITDGGELGQIDTSDQQMLQSFGGEGGPSSSAQAEGSSSYLSGAWQLHGTPRIYVSTCCEPAGGNGLYIDAETTLQDRANSYAGFAAVPSPDASLLAIPQLLGLYLGEALPQPSPTMISDTQNEGRASVAWLRDRRGVVWAPHLRGLPGTVEIIELDDANAPVATRSVQAPGIFNVSVAVRADGAIVVAGCDQGPQDLSRCDHSIALVLDPDTGEVISEFTIEAGARLGGYDYTGTYLIYTAQDGVARWAGAGQSGVLGSGFRWASW